jgi:glycosyltransferase involved in cell wall biosynthesis
VLSGTASHRVAIFTDTYVPHMNGVARTLTRLAESIERRGGEAQIFTTTDPASVASARITRFPSIAFPLYGELRVAAPASSRVRDALRRFQPSIVHIATPFGIGLAGRRAARALRVPWVSSYHTSFSAYARHYGLPWLSQPLWAFLRAFHNSGRRTYCPTFATRNELIGHGFERVHVWSRGVDRTRFTPKKHSTDMRARMGAATNELVVAYVGRMAREKGLDDLVSAAHVASRDVRLSHLRFAFAGDGPYLEELRGRVPTNCTLLGRLEGDDLATFYASADVFAFPSLTDTFGNVLLEAMASGLPIIAADAASSREVAGEAGVYYNGGDVAGLSARIGELASRADVRAARAAASVARAGQFDSDAIIDDLLAGYRDACSESKGEMAAR